MRCTNNKLAAALIIGLAMIGLAGCSNVKYEMPYEADKAVSSFNVIPADSGDTAELFAADICVVTDDYIEGTDVDMSEAEAAVLFSLNSNDVVYAKNAHERLYPASITKVMTALVALKYGSLDQVMTASDAVNITESGAQTCGLKKGDRMTLDQALHILLMYSANDVAMMIAENIGGTVEQFVHLMNMEAYALGATNTNFVNPHGLNDSDHYTTAYDLYLMFNEAVKYEIFSEIIGMTSYQTTFYSGEGKEKNLSFETTNRFLKGHFSAPSKVTVIGGKTGTTNAAGACLILLSRDVKGNPYISCILRAANSDALYTQMADLLDEINN